MKKPRKIKTNLFCEQCGRPYPLESLHTYGKIFENTGLCYTHYVIERYGY